MGQNLVNSFSEFRESQFKEPISHTCRAGTVVASWSLTQDEAGLSPFAEMANIFVTEFIEFSKNI